MEARFWRGMVVEGEEVGVVVWDDIVVRYSTLSQSSPKGEREVRSI